MTIQQQPAGQGDPVAQGQPNQNPAGEGAPGAGGTPGAVAQGAAPGAVAQPAAPRPRTMTTDLPAEQLAARLERERQAERRRLGVDDPKKLQADREELLRLRKEKEERDRAAMTESEKLQADLAALRAEKDQLASRLKEREEALTYEQQQRRITGLASNAIDPEAIDFALHRFGKHVAQLDPRKRARMTDKDVSDWFADFAAKNPKFAKGQAGTPPAPPKPAASTVRRPSNGMPPQKTVPAPAKPADTSGGLVNGKTIKPGQSNSMTPAEVRAYAASQGIRYPS